MNIAIFNPDLISTYATLTSFRVAFFDCMENIESTGDLEHRLDCSPDWHGYTHQGAANSAILSNDPLYSMSTPGDYMIVQNCLDKVSQRYTVVSEESDIFGIANLSIGMTAVIDPFGEIVKSYRSDILTDILKKTPDEDEMESPDCDLSAFLTTTT